ncbi:MAG: hypothetical protein HY052_03770 [Proteobacteria bacterium]|nr:hypothetical protein [Pseudomonadota bacterium]
MDQAEFGVIPGTILPPPEKEPAGLLTPEAKTGGVSKIDQLVTYSVTFS